MVTKNLSKNYEAKQEETLDTYILKENDYKISNKARYTGFQHRSKVEFLKFFIV